MIGVPINPNSVYIPMIQTGCFKSEFDSTYPIHLNGIINQQEFRESINKINRRISSNKILIIFTIGFCLTIIIGIIFFIVGGITNINSGKHGFPVLIGVGIAITAIGPIVCACGCFMIQSRRLGRLQQAISEESIKYSSRSPIGCSWRLDTSRAWFRGYGYHHNTQLVYHLVIDIGRSSNGRNLLYQSNQVAPDPTYFYEQQDNYAPPPYYSQLAAFCAHCNSPRQDLSAKFCSSCGHEFHK
ncbi:unnamed protein product [Rotaria sp. Silwood2]|nr:unnamed protein product [Rotaria sp. Silwood2]CAF4466263.1 unnamed protein product [Rotaria sp. Silwood2]